MFYGSKKAVSEPTTDLQEEIVTDEEGQRLRRRAESTKQRLHRIRLAIRLIHLPVSYRPLKSALIVESLAWP